MKSIFSRTSLVAMLRNFSRVASLTIILIGGLVLLGWVFRIAILKSIAPELPTMKANTAIAFLITGLAIWFLLKTSATRLERGIVQVCSIVVALLGLLTLSEYFFNWQLGIDQWLFPDTTIGTGNFIPGRMSPTTALNFFLIGVALLFLDRKTSRGDYLAQVLALVIAFLGGLALLGYVYGAAALYEFGAYNQIAAHTALTFMLVAASLLCIRPEHGLMATITTEYVGSLTARRLLPPALILPVCLGWLYLQAQKLNYFNIELGEAIVTTSTILVIASVIWWNARLLNQTDAQLKIAQAADLRLNEERLRHVIWAIRDAIWDRNMVTGEIWWNESLRKLFHYQDRDIKSNVEWWEERIHPDDREKIIRSIATIVETGQNFWSEEYRFRRADGTYANIFDRGYVLFNEQTGQPQRMIGAMADITQQKEVEQSLRQSQELFSKAFSASPAGITLTRKSDGRVIEVNDAYLEMTGYRRGEVINHTTLELGLISTEDRARLLRVFEEKGTVRDFEYWMRTKSGHLKAVFSSLEQVSLDATTCFLAIIYDITERKRSEIAQEQSEALFRTLFELSPDSVLIIDPYDSNVSWPIIDCNAAACLMNGYERDELIGQSIDILNGTVGTPAERKTYMEMLRGAGSIKAEFQHRHKNGNFFPIETSTTLIRIGERELIIGIDRDITERRRTEDALRDANDNLKRGLTEFDQRNREIMLLNELSNLLQTCQTPDEAYTLVGNLIPSIFPETKGALYILTASENNIVEAVATWNLSPADEVVFASEDCFALRRGRPYMISEAHPGLLCKHLSGTPSSYICVPMISQGEALGVFHLQNSQSDETHGHSRAFDQGLVETVADTISLAIANLKLRETLRNQSTRDLLTGLHNRRFMDESLTREIHRATRNQHPLGIIMLDIDHFKNFNDTFGHEAGDTVLHELGNFLMRSIRKGDIACRYGGEEFLLLLPEATLENTRQRAQELCEEVRKIEVQYRGETLGNLTVSIGVAAFPDYGESRDDVVQAADRALYHAKKEGRNRVIVAGEIP